MPGYGWLPFDPTPGRGTLSAAYTVASDSADARRALGGGLFLDFSGGGSASAHSAGGAAYRPSELGLVARAAPARPPARPARRARRAEGGSAPSRVCDARPARYRRQQRAPSWRRSSATREQPCLQMHRCETCAERPSISGWRLTPLPVHSPGHGTDRQKRQGMRRWTLAASWPSSCGRSARGWGPVAGCEGCSRCGLCAALDDSGTIYW